MSSYTRPLVGIVVACAGVSLVAFGIMNVANRVESLATSQASVVPTATPIPTITPTVTPPPPLVVPTEYQGLLLRAAKRCPQVPIEILAAQIQVESDWQPRAKSPAGARGIAQFMKSTWKAYSVDGDGDGKKSIWNPADAIVSASVYNCALLNYVRDVPGDEIIMMLAAYNAGPGAVRKHDGIPPFPETQQYVDKVLSASQRIVPYWTEGETATKTVTS